MKKLTLTLLCLLAVIPVVAQPTTRGVEPYDAAAAKSAAQNDLANWMSYLPDEVFVAHVSIPGTHDTATGHGFNATGIISASTHASNSQTQVATIDEQLAAGVRAFDFRPGMMGSGSSRYLNCNHGISPTKIKMDEAFNKLTDYLDNHPGEFFVIHLFRGNVYTSNAPMYGYDSASDKEYYNYLFDEFFNKGKFSNYIVEYSPYLKVKDIRGKMVVFRRDRIDFAHVAKAGNLTYWPGDTEIWSENSKVQVTHASNPTIKGIIRATDVSSPENENELSIETNAITDLFNYNCNQIHPNDAKRAGSYKPDWSMIFTSGAYEAENRTGYLKNATYTNPLLTNLIKNAEKKGPTGVVFSDWVLTDEYSGYKTMGVELIPTILYNNFDYISEYILDEDLFPDNVTDVENLWVDNAEYIMRNAATGTYLSSGATWGSHAALKSDPIIVKPAFDKNNNVYTLTTSQGSLGIDWEKQMYVDYGTATNFNVTYSGNGNYFYFDYNNGEKNVRLTATPSTDWKDGTTHSVNGEDIEDGNLAQQWELIKFEDFHKSNVADASLSNGVDVSYEIKGHRFLPNDKDNWTGTTNYKEVKPLFGGSTTIHASYIDYHGTNNWYDKEQVLHCHNTSSNSSNNSNTVWSFTHIDNVKDAGIYKLRFKAGYNNFTLSENTLTFKVNGSSEYKAKLQSIGSDDAAVCVEKFRANPETYTIEIDLTLNAGDEIKFEASKTKTNSITSFYLDDIELIYYGPDPTVTCAFIKKALDDANAKISVLPDNIKEGWNEEMAPYTAMVESRNVVGDGTKEVKEIYVKLRSRVLSNVTENADFTGAIMNNSFELGTGLGWDYQIADQVDVKPNSDSTYTVNENDGDYLFNAWQKGVPVTQIIPDFPAGHYKLQARAVTGDSYGDPRYVNLIAGNGHSDGISINTDKVNWSEIEYEFDILETQDIMIGIVGSTPDGRYNEIGDWWYKADYFRLTRMGEPQMQGFYDYLQQVIDWTTAQVQTLPAAYVAEWDMSEYQALIDNRTLVGDGKTEAAEIYAKMRALVLSQTEPAADMTLAITNNSFEMGDMTGWSCATGGDTGVKKSEDVYTTDGIDGTYLFNTYINNGKESALAVTQTLPALRAGKYELKALVCSDKGNKYFLAANDQTQAITISEDNNNVRFEEVTLRFKVAEDNTDVVIGVYPAVNGEFVPDGWGAWYKADNFRLSYVGTLEETIVWTMRGDTYDTLILPFDAEIPEGLTAHVAAGFDTSIESTEYHVIDLQPVATLLANTAYVMQRIPQAAEAQYSQRAALPRAAAVDYEFTGVPVEADGELTTGLLTGTLTGTSVEQGHYVLIHQDANSYFNRHEAEEAAEVEANHAYIAKETLESVGATNPVIHFAEPVADNPVSVSELNADEVEVSVYTATGVEVRRGVKLSKAFEGLDPGFYILSNGKRVILK